MSLQPKGTGAPQPGVAGVPQPARSSWEGSVFLTQTLLHNEPLAETYFGPEGFCATAQSNHAAQNLGSRGRTLHAANGLLMADSLQTARLGCNAQTQRKMDRLAGDLGVDVIDELGCVPSCLLDGYAEPDLDTFLAQR